MLVGCSQEQPASTNAATTAETPAVAPQSSADAVKRGEYLVTIMACHDCHTPFKNGPNGPEPDMTRSLSGHPAAMGKMPPVGKLNQPWLWSGAATNTAFAGPWGVSYAVNLTPDPKTGTGIWNEQMFVQAIRTGKHLGAGRPIMPPMPWPAYRSATDEDLKAIFAYTRTLTPITNKVPDYEPPVSQ